jgi:hypothetical protein
MDTNKNIAKKRNEYCCQMCYYNTFNKYDYLKHCETVKHKTAISLNDTNEISQKTQKQKVPINKVYSCHCGKEYKHQSSLCAHKKKCKVVELQNQITPDLVIKLIEQNKELQQFLIEQNKQNTKLQNKIIEMTSKSTTTNNTNSHNTTNNKTFNLQFFLNETCKNAMNITDFVSSIKFSLEDLENTGRTGYIEGISNIIIKNLNKLEINQRPLHCSDLKRETLYIKDNNKWEKEIDENPLLTKAVKEIANENIKQIKTWKDNYPDCIKSESRKNDLYLKIVSNSMNGLTKEESDKNINKIITNVSKNVIIEK